MGVLASASFFTCFVARTARAQLWSPAGLRGERLDGSDTTTRSRLNGFSASAVTPTLYVISNSTIPYSLNDGPLWAGRGISTSITAGGTLSYNTAEVSLRATIAPTFVASQNLPFQIFRGADPGRSVFSSPWHTGLSSADLPLRFGDRAIRAITTGESTIEAVAGNVVAGVSSASEWWGPGIRNALVMSDNAGGIPRVFVRSNHRIGVPFGDVSAELILGTLTESNFFDADPKNDYRSLSGALFTFRPKLDTTLTLGFARVVYAPSSGAVPPISRALDALVHWERLASPADTFPGGATRQHADQVFSLFGRWAIPAARTEIYGEWARMEPPRSLREWLVAPQSTQGFTLGLQSARPINTGKFLRGQLEFTNLEQTAVFPNRPPPDYYTGRASPQGYTQRGQVIGAAIGPGASSQFAALDYIVPRWQIGAIVGRTRWENDALYRQPAPNAGRHDVSIYSGIRGSSRVFGVTTAAQVTVARRFNYLFQNDAASAGETPRSAIDLQNVTVEFQISK